MKTALFVIGLLLLIALIQGLIWFLVLRALRRLVERLRDELRGKRIVCGPERLAYDGGTGGHYPRVRGLVAAAITDDRLLIRRILGKGFDVPIRDITRVRQQESWNGRRRVGKLYVTVQTERGEFGVVPRDPSAWTAALGPAGTGYRGARD